MYILSLLWSLKRRFRKKESDTSGKKQCQQRRGWKWDFSLVGLGPPHCALQVKCNNWNRFLDRRRMLMQSCALDVCGGSVEWTFVEPRTHSIPERIWVVSRLSIKNKFPFFFFFLFFNYSIAGAKVAMHERQRDDNGFWFSAWDLWVVTCGPVVITHRSC